MSDKSIFKRGLISEKEERIANLRTKITAYRDSIDMLLLRHPLDIENVDIEGYKKLTAEHIATMEEYRQLHREIEMLKG